MTRVLLPSGLADVLPPLAAREFKLVHHFLKNFMAFGYQPVIPPLAEYSSSLLAGQGEATAHHTLGNHRDHCAFATLATHCAPRPKR